MMDTPGPAAVHGTAELLSGNREDLFQPYVTEQLVNIVCGGCGLSCGNHDTWEEHVREITVREDEEHNNLFEHICTYYKQCGEDYFR